MTTHPPIVPEAAAFLDRAHGELAGNPLREWILKELAEGFGHLYRLGYWRDPKPIGPAPVGVPEAAAELAVHSPLVASEDAWASFELLAELEEPQGMTGSAGDAQQWITGATDQAYNLYVLATGREIGASNLDVWRAVTVVAEARADVEAVRGGGT
ncbi:hypothetical protein ACFY4B_27285 [Kitasatospora sp. NPDC001261]|uniref:hypothetical protein n=1 Tax=Kitasatospora sp. NPDC001261 TaxID=3364012 RepID=UPI0036924E14